MRILYLLFLSLITQLAIAQPSGDSFEAKHDYDISKFYSQNGKMGLQKGNNKPICPAVYDTLYAANSTRYIAQRYQSSSKQSLWGIIDEKGLIILPIKFRKLTVEYSFSIVGLQIQNQILYGVYSLEGTEVIPPRHEAVNVLSGQYIAIKQNQDILLFNQFGEKITALQADSVALLNSNYLKYYRNGKAGIFNIQREVAEAVAYSDIKIANGDFLIKKIPKWTVYKGYDTLFYRYENISEWGNNLIVGNKGKSWIINENNVDVSIAYDSIKKISANLALVKINSRWGVIDYKGNEIITPQYQCVLSDGEMIYAKGLGNDGRWTIFDNYGFQKTKHRYDSVLSGTQGRIAIKRNGKWGFLDRYGKEAIAPIFDAVKPFKDDLSMVTFFREDGMIDRQGKWIVTPSKIQILDYKNRTLLGKKNGQYQVKDIETNSLIYFTGNKLTIYNKGFIESDSTGKPIRFISWNGTFVPTAGYHEDTMTGGAGLVIFKDKNRYGFKDQQGRIVIANRYEEVRPFHQRLAAIKINRKWGFINLDEQIIVQPQFDSVGSFKKKLCIVKKDGFLGVINLKGQVIVSNKYSSIEQLSSGKLRVEKDGKWGMLNENGSVLIHPKYDQLIPVSESLFIIQRNSKYGTISSNGVNVLPLIYDFIGYSSENRTLFTKQHYKNEWTFLRKVHSY